MEYINIHRSVLDGAEFVGAEPIERATWLSLLAFCCGQENGGVIAGCKAWADRRWQQLAKVTADEVTRVTELWKWDGDDLVVNFYPEQAEKETRAKRRGGIIGNKRRWGKKPKPPSLTDKLSESLTDGGSDKTSDSLTESITERNGTERNGTEESLADFPEVSIPSIEDVRAWATSSGRVDPDWAARKWQMTTGNNGWQRNGRLIGWQRLWIVWFEEDVRAGKWKKSGEKSPELSANIVAIQDGKRRAVLEAKIRTGKAEVENLKALGQDYRAEKRAVEILMDELDDMGGAA